MKKVLFSSVCAVALLGINAYAEPTTVITSSLEDFLTQKKDLENKINVQNTLVTQKQESVNIANTAYQAKDKAYKDLSTAIITLTTQAGEKEGLKNKAELEHTVLVNQGTELNIQKDNLNSEILGLESNINKYSEDLKLFEIQLTAVNSDITEKQAAYNKAYEELKVANQDKQKLVDNEDKIGKEHLALQEKFKLASEQEKLAIEKELNAKAQELAAAQKAIEDLDEKNRPLMVAKDEAEKALNQAKQNATSIKNNQTDTTSKHNQAKLDLETKKQALATTTVSIEKNTQEITNAKTKFDAALKAYNEALANIETAKQNQANVKVELDTASENLEKAKQDLLTAQAEFDKLNQDLKELEGNIANNTEVGKQSKEEMGENYKASTQELANKLITLSAENNGDLSTATPEVKAQAQAIANEIASVIINEQKSEISSDVLSSLNVSINNMNKRLGEIRGLNEDLGVWFRAYGGRFSNDNSHFNYYSTQIGADKKTDFNNGDLIAGALFGYDKVNSNAKSKGFNVGGYLSYISNDGYFADLVLKYIHTGYDKASIKSQNSFLASVESGYRFNVYQNTYLEPSLELITGYVGKYEAQIGKNTISTKSYVPLIIKPQVFAGYSVNDFTFRAGVGAILDTKKHTANILINDLVKGINASSNVKLDSNNRGFVSLGGSYKFNDNLRLNLSVERSFGSSLTNDYEINSTIRYTF